MWNYCAFSRFATELAVAWHCYSLELHLEPGWVFLNGFFFPFFFYLFIYFNHPRLFFFYFITIPLILQTMYLTVCKMEERRKKKQKPARVRGLWQASPWIPHSPPRANFFFSCLLKNPLPPHRREWPFRDQGTLDYIFFFPPSLCDTLLIAWGKREAEGWGEQGRRVERRKEFSSKSCTLK